MEISALPIAPSHRAKLTAAGYTTIASLSSISAAQLALDINVELQEACAIMKTISESKTFGRLDRGHPVGSNSLPILGGQTAWEMLSEEQVPNQITTSSNALDDILGGGIHCSEVTEIGGVPGIGKTQLGIQLAVNAQIPIDCGGLNGKAIYIDTEGSFMVERAHQIAEACVKDILDKYDPERILSEEHKEKNPNRFLENMFYFRICSYTEQIAVINYLEKFLMEHKNVRIVVIDSITFHFRQDFEDLALRTRVLGEVSLKLMKLAKTFHVAVVLLNQVTTKFTEGSFQLTLALGDSWSHACTNRLILYWNGNERFGYLDKSPSLPSASAPFVVTAKGIRDAIPQHKRVRLMQS